MAHVWPVGDPWNFHSGGACETIEVFNEALELRPGGGYFGTKKAVNASGNTRFRLRRGT